MILCFFAFFIFRNWAIGLPRASRTPPTIFMTPPPQKQQQRWCRVGGGVGREARRRCTNNNSRWVGTSRLPFTISSTARAAARGRPDEEGRETTKQQCAITQNKQGKRPGAWRDNINWEHTCHDHITHHTHRQPALALEQPKSAN